jgi:hypothetical protein
MLIGGYATNAFNIASLALPSQPLLPFLGEEVFSFRGFSL